MYVSLPEVKTYLETSEVDSDLLMSLTEAAETRVDEYIGHSVASVTVYEKFPYSILRQPRERFDTFVLSRFPIDSLLTVYSGGVEADSDSYVLDKQNSILRFFQEQVSDIEVRYVGGITANSLVKTVVKKIVKILYDNTETDGYRTMTVGDMSVVFSSTDKAVEQALSLLSSYQDPVARSSLSTIE